MHSWLEEFYPIPADELKTASDTECLKHSILKWNGLLKKNLKKHKVTFFDKCVFDDDSPILRIDGDSCALCQNNNYKSSCTTCPLYTLLGHACDIPGEKEPFSLYLEATTFKHPIKMIHALKKCLKREEKNHE